MDVFQSLTLAAGPGLGTLAAGPGLGTLAAGPGLGPLAAGPGLGTLAAGPGLARGAGTGLTRLGRPTGGLDLGAGTGVTRLGRQSGHGRTFWKERDPGRGRRSWLERIACRGSRRKQLVKGPSVTQGHGWQGRLGGHSKILFFGGGHTGRLAELTPRAHCREHDTGQVPCYAVKCTVSPVGVHSPEPALLHVSC